MKIIRKAPLAIAIAGLFGAVPAANAFQAVYMGGTAPVYAEDVLNDADDVAALADTLMFKVRSGDSLLNVSQSFNVVLELADGTFEGVTPANCNVAVLGSAAYANTTSSSGNVATDYEWDCSLAGFGTSTLTLLITPDPGASSPGILAGNLIELAPGALGISGANGLSQLTMSYSAVNPNNGFQYGGDPNFVLGRAAPGVTFDSDLTNGSVDSRIDVGANDPRTVFSPDGTIGGSNTNPEAIFNAGDFVLDIARYDTETVTSSQADTQQLECIGVSDASSNCHTGGPTEGFVFNTGVDTVTVTLKGTDFSAFDAIWLADAGQMSPTPTDTVCAYSGGPSYEVSMATGTGLTVNPDTATGTFYVDYATTNTISVCLQADETTAIAAQPLSIALQVNFDDDGVDGVTSPVSSGDLALLPLLNNGSEVDLYMVNPGSNTLAQGFMRICHTGSVPGQVTMEGIDDQGQAAPGGDITFDLSPNECKMLNSQDLEGGNATKGLTGAFGTGAGKWFVTATGEFGGLRGAAYIRNTASGDIYNVSNSSLDRSELPGWAKTIGN